MDELDELESLDKVDDSEDIKNKIFFSVLVVSTIIFICIYSCDSFKKVVIIYLKWVKPAKTENPVTSRSSVFLCSETSRKRLLRRL